MKNFVWWIVISISSACAIDPAVDNRTDSSNEQKLDEIQLNLSDGSVMNSPDYSGGMNSPDYSGGMNSPDYSGGMNSPDYSGGMNSPDYSGGMNSPDYSGGMNSPDYSGMNSLGSANMPAAGMAAAVTGVMPAKSWLNALLRR